MATTTVRPNLNGALLNVAANEFLEYTLTIQGARANFAWVDDESTTILGHTDFGLVNQIVFQLKTGPQGGQALITVPQKAGYQRLLNIGSDVDFALTLGFITATGYTLTVKKCNAAGPLQTITDVDLTPNATSDPVIQALAIGLR